MCATSATVWPAVLGGFSSMLPWSLLMLVQVSHTQADLQGWSLIQIDKRSAIEKIIDFDPRKWNDNLSIKMSHNCYEYALNDIDPSAADHCAAYVDKHPKKAKKCRRWFHIPGYHYHQNHHDGPVRFNKSSITCENMLRRIAEDGQGSLLWQGPNGRPTHDISGRSWEHDDNCPRHAYMAAVVVQPHKRFHFYRRDLTCQKRDPQGRLCWSHKPGILNATRYDASGKEMPDLYNADRHYGKHSYSQVCGFFCVPGNKFAATHSDFYRGHGPPNWASI